MLVRFAPGKIVRPNQSTVTVSITAYRDSQELEFEPLGGSSVLTAPSSLILDRRTNTQYYLAKPFSSVHNALTAVASTTAQIDLV